jgi:uncharacterized protein YwqG
LLFLAAIDCAELRGLPGSDQLPSSGMLAFFADSNGVTALDFAPNPIPSLVLRARRACI